MDAPTHYPKSTKPRAGNTPAAGGNPNQADPDALSQLTRFTSLAVKIIGSLSAAVAAISALYAAMFSPNTDLLRLLAFASTLLAIITLGVGVALFTMTDAGALPVRMGSSKERLIALRLLIPLASGLVIVAAALFVLDHLMTPTMSIISLLDNDSAILRIQGSGFGSDASNIKVRFSAQTAQEFAFVVKNLKPGVIEVAVPPMFKEGNITVQRGPRVSSPEYFTYPGVIYDVAVVELEVSWPDGDPINIFKDKFEPYPNFPYYSDSSDAQSYWPPQMEKDQHAFYQLMQRQLSGEAGKELARWQNTTPNKSTFIEGNGQLNPGGESELKVEESYMQLRSLLMNNLGDISKLRSIVGPHCASALATLEKARKEFASRLPNRLLILRIRNLQMQDVDKLALEIEAGGPVYDVTVNKEGEKAKTLERTEEGINIKIPSLSPKYITEVKIWYYYLEPGDKHFPEPADFEWARTQGIVIGNMVISNGQLLPSQALFADLNDAYHRFPVDPVKSSPTFGTVINIQGVHTESQ